MKLTIRPLTPDRWPALEHLFGKGGASNDCWCLYWRIGPQYHRRPREKNRSALRGIIVNALSIQWTPSALIAAALKATKHADAPALEAYPVDTTRSGSTSDVFTGTASPFRRAGFKTVARRLPSRPIMRHDLKGIAG